MSDKLGDAFVEISARDEKLRANLARQLTAIERHVSRANAIGSRIGSSFGSSLDIAKGVLGGSLLVRAFDQVSSSMSDMVSKGFAYNAAIEKASVSFNTLIGNEQKAAAMMEKLRVYAAKTPFELPELNKAAVSLLATKKIASEQVLPILQKLGDAAAGSSEGFASMPRITRAISQMLTKGKIQAEEMMQLSEAGVPAWSALASEMGKSTAQVQKMGEKGQLGIKEVMKLVDGLGKTYAGLADKQSQTFEGLTSTIKDNVSKALGDAFKPLFESSKKGMKFLVAMFDSPKFQAFIDKLASGVEWLVSGFEKLVNSPLAQAVAKFAALTLGATAFYGAVSLAIPAVMTLFSAAPVIALTAAMGGLATLIYRTFTGENAGRFFDILAKSKEKIDGIAANLSEKLLPILNSVASAFGAMFGSDGTIQGGFDTAIGAILEGLDELLGKFELLTTQSSLTSDLFLSYWDLALIDLDDSFKHLFTVTIPGYIKSMWDAMAAGTKEAAKDPVKFVDNSIDDAPLWRKAMRIGLPWLQLSDALTAKGAVGDATKKAFDESLGKNAPGREQSPESRFLQDRIAGLWGQMEDRRAEQNATRNEERARQANIRADKLLRESDFMKLFSDEALAKSGQEKERAQLEKLADPFRKFWEGLGMFAGAVPAGVKTPKSEFVGLAEMNKKIQSSLSKSSEEQDRKRHLKMIEDSKKLLGDIKGGGDQLIDVSKQMLAKLGMT